VAPDDWQREPSPLAEIHPGSGEIIWSTLFPSEVANEVLELDVDNWASGPQIVRRESLVGAALPASW
jgi:hypothetical protein